VTEDTNIYNLKKGRSVSNEAGLFVFKGEEMIGAYLIDNPGRYTSKFVHPECAEKHEKLLSRVQMKNESLCLYHRCARCDGKFSKEKR
jgi:hypothetical protein